MGFLGAGAKIFGGNPHRNAMIADLRRLVKKNYGDALNTLVCRAYTRQRNYKRKNNKRNVYAVRVTFHPCAALTPLNL